MGLKAIDFFCGIGGVTRGFLNRGIDVIAGIDNDINCKETYEANNIRPNGVPSKFLKEDISTLDIKKIKELIKPTDKLILIGCAPCQSFTGITKKLEGRKKERELLKCFSEIILKLHPEYIFLENVQGLKSPNNKKVLDSFIDSLRPFYDLKPQVINAMNYGVPQSRRRVILFAKRNGHVDYPTATHGKIKGQKELKSLYHAIGNLPPIMAASQHKELKTHVTSKLSELNLQRLKLQKNPGDGMEKWTRDLCLKSRKEGNYIGHRDVYARLYWYKPCGTLTTKFISISNGRFAHPSQNRGLSILEGLLIQTFPKNYKMLCPSLRAQAKQIGNAVPVKLAEAFATKIIQDSQL